MTTTPTPSPALPLAALADLIERVRTAAPRVHALTSPVAAERTANTLLAVGARPSLTINPSEVADFLRLSGALLVNLGMLDDTRIAAISAGLQTARAHGKPWVLDPVFADASPSRRVLTERLLAERPAVFKMNAAEAGLADIAPSGIVRVVTGPTDHITDGARRIAIANGHPLSGSVTAMGCALGGLIAAYLAVEPDAFRAAAAAVAVYGLAGEQAALKAAGPGTFAVHFLDCLAAIDGEALIRHARVS